MARRRKAPATSFGLWADSVAVGVATMTTLAVRVPQILAGTMATAERQRMLAEKVAAAQTGMIEASLVAGDIALRGPRRLTAARLIRTGALILDAASAPARRTVKANAKRLTKPSGGRGIRK